jgi:flavin reductase (DIM6/NTAB) family NADH-FMN oxidoreductase RutF
MNKQWVKALGTMTYGIYALTAAHEGRMNAMIASWASQVSFDPPLIAVAVHPDRYSHALIDKSGCFGLHVLKKTQKSLITRFMGSDATVKFENIDWQAGKTGSPLLTDCVARFECQLLTRIQPGNHTLFIGEVVDAKSVSEDERLTTRDYRGQYIGKA